MEKMATAEFLCLCSPKKESNLAVKSPMVGVVTFVTPVWDLKFF